MGVGATGRRLGRRAFLSASLGSVAAAAAFAPVRAPWVPGAAAQETSTSDPGTGQSVSSLGESNLSVYVPETGHTLSGVLLDYWRATGGDLLFGNPISEPFTAPDGRYSQAFERAILQFRSDLTWTVEPYVRPMPVGRILLGQQASGVRADGKRAGGGGLRQTGVWAPAVPGNLDPLDEELLVVETTGHTVSGPLLDWYRRHEGDYYLGDPLSEPFDDRGQLVQWFEGGQLVQTDDGVELAPLGRQMADRLRLETKPVDQNDVPEFDETLFWSAPNPYLGADPDARGAKRIEVNVTQQQMRAYQGDALVIESLISTGLVPNETERGRFRIRYKTPIEDMRGATDDKGDVVWVVGDGGGPPRGSIPYGVPDVPNVMYVNLDAEALHGAYWHNNFGNPMSHGCINQPLDVAAFMYGWAALGTPVAVFLESGASYPGT